MLKKIELKDIYAKYFIEEYHFNSDDTPWKDHF